MIPEGVRFLSDAQLEIGDCLQITLPLSELPVQVRICNKIPVSLSAGTFTFGYGCQFVGSSAAREIRQYMDQCLGEP